MKSNRKKVLVIKLGYSETLDREIGKISSLGDVLRTTVILPLFKKYTVTWLVDKKAYAFLKNNKYISEILIYNNNSLNQIRRQQYDSVINYEKDLGICKFLDSIKAEKYYGFNLDRVTGKLHFCPGSKEAFSICSDIEIKRRNRKYWQKIIFNMAGGIWKREKYILGYKPTSKFKYDIGLNWAVGSKWPNKAWPREYFYKLAELIDDKYSYSWQKGLNSIYDYIEWVNSCRLLITADSLGQHLAIALKRKVLILYGPTNPFETYLYGLGKKILPQVKYNCIPCLQNNCVQKRHCLESIRPESVIKEADKLLKKRL